MENPAMLLAKNGNYAGLSQIPQAFQRFKFNA